MALQTVNQRCYLLEIPKELRLTIYELVYAEEHWALILVGDEMCYGEPDQTTHKAKSLLLTCNQIYQEAFPTFINTAAIHICISADQVRDHLAPHSQLGVRETSSILKKATKVYLQRFHSDRYNESTYLKRIAKVLEGLDYCKNVESLEMNLRNLLPRAQEPARRAFEVLRDIQCPKDTVCSVSIKPAASWGRQLFREMVDAFAGRFKCPLNDARYDPRYMGVIPFIPWAKANVEDGEMESGDESDLPGDQEWLDQLPEDFKRGG